MATTGRQTKGTRKGPPEPTAARRTTAWTGARGSPTYSPSTASPRQQPTQAPPIQNSFPPLAQINGARPDNPRDRVLQALSGLTGTTVTLQTKTSQRYEGVVGSTTSEGDTAGVTLKDVKDITTPGAPLKDQLFIPSVNIDSYTSGPADAKPANGDSFRTDADISHNKGVGRERDLQAWVASEDTITPASNLVGDDDTFGLGANGNGNSWDQFSANETLFGVKASFDEDVYTTKLDRSAPDFKERERKAQRIANEIIGAATSNPHIAEERGFNVDDSGVNEEDKYGAVVRGQNAYVPPGARKTGGGSENVVSTKGDVPKVSVNGPDGTSVAAQAQSPPSSKEVSPAPPTSGSVSNPTDKPPADPLPAFIAFVTDERRRLTQKRQALVKSEMDKRMAELVKFSKDFKLNKPIPEDLVPILAKDQEKQRAIKEKASKDAASSQARAIGASNPTTASRGLAVAGAKNSDSSRKPITQALGSKIASNNAQASITAANAQKMAIAAAASAAAAATAAAKPAEGTTSKKISMVIQTIPPFKGKDKGKQDSNAITTTSSTPVTANGASTNSTQNTTNHNATRSSASPAIVPASPNTIANRLNVNASSFRPNPKANAFNPVPSTKTHAPSAASMSSPKANKLDSAPTTPNPFFGRPIKKSPPVHIKDDFNPFKHNKVVDAAQVATLWPYSGKRYMQLFPTPQYQPAQHSAHMAPPVPPPMPPPSHEEDSAAQAAATRGYVYAYPPYGYPAQHMMQGMPPPGPPGAYMPGPYMQPMPYPPGMPPPSAMYSPGMGQMPPPQGYMPPPPGAYPPPPNGAGPRPSMPPTPIQANAHPYYHQSPQLQHAYPMMMPPPPSIPPHGYEGGPPPVQMGGHS